MLLYFGHDFDALVHAPPTPQRAGEYFFCPFNLLLWLKGLHSLSTYPNNTALRIELSRKAHSNTEKTPTHE